LKSGRIHSMKRQKSSATCQEKLPYLLLDQQTPLHGDFPFHIVHLHCFQMDIYSESSLPQEIVRIPWVSLAVDAYSRRRLAVYIAFDLPRYASYLMVLRECVRRFARLPEILVIDEDPLGNDRFEYFLSLYGITKVERPRTEQDKGSSIEQSFGMTDIDFIQDVLNGTRTGGSLEEATKTNRPDFRVSWPLGDFYERLCEWCYEVYDTRLHPALAQTPREVYQAAMLLRDAQPSRMVPYDEVFRISALPSRRMARVHQGYGVNALGEFYWSEAFRDPGLERATVQIAYDPADTSHIFAFAKKQWHKCKRLRWVPVLD
jgi:putative transposase